MVEGLVRLLAPILPITTDELWRALPGTRVASVHLALLPADVGGPGATTRWSNAGRG